MGVFPYPSHAAALVFVVSAFGGCLAFLLPSSGFVGFIKNWLLCVIALSVLMLVGALGGKVLHDFLFEMA